MGNYASSKKIDPRVAKFIGFFKSRISWEILVNSALLMSFKKIYGE